MINEVLESRAFSASLAAGRSADSALQLTASAAGDAAHARTAMQAEDLAEVGGHRS
jgi:hypothetical protein